MSLKIHSLPATLMAVVVIALLLTGGLAAPASAQATEQVTQTIGQDSSTVVTLDPDASGWPAGFAADVVASADLETFVVDVYVDGVLATSEENPTTIAVEFEPTSVSRFIRVDVREFGETSVCEVNSGAVQLQNIDVERVPSDDDEIALINEPFWMVEAGSVAEVANVAAIGTIASTVEDFQVREDAGVTVAVGSDEDFDTSVELWEEIGTEDGTLPNVGERLVVTKLGELSLTGGEVFISESEFGGRVGSVRLSAEALLSPQANSESGFALRVNGQIIETGIIDANGQATIDVVIAEQDWPRDATVTLDLSLTEAETSCSDDRFFSGQVEFTVTPLGVPSSELTVSDFPTILLEGTSTIFADDVSDHDVAVVSSALQAISTKRIVVADAETVEDALVVVERGPQGSVTVEENQLVVTLDDELIETLQEERFWIYTGAAGDEQDSVEVVPESLAFVDVDQGPLDTGIGGLSLFRIVPFALLVILVAAVLSLLWKNSKAPAES